jgi:hypothetical protein
VTVNPDFEINTNVTNDDVSVNGNKETLTNKVKTLFKSLSKEPEQKNKRGRPKKKEERASTVTIFQLPYLAISTKLLNSEDPKAKAYGAILQFQSGSAPLAIDTIIADTFIDRLLQPFAKIGKHSVPWLVVMLPFLASQAMKSEERYLLMRPFIIQSIQANIIFTAQLAEEKPSTLISKEEFEAACKKLDMPQEIIDNPELLLSFIKDIALANSGNQKVTIQ